MRHREVKKFPKSTYATGHAGIPGESQNETTGAVKNPGFIRLIFAI